MILLNDIKEHTDINSMSMEEEMPENLIKEKASETKEFQENVNMNTERNESANIKNNNKKSNKKIQLNFSVERLLSAEQKNETQSCDNLQNIRESAHRYHQSQLVHNNEQMFAMYSGMETKPLVRPTPIRVLNTPTDTATLSATFPNAISLMRFQQKSTNLAQALQSLMTLPLNHSLGAEHFSMSSAASLTTMLPTTQLCAFQNNANNYLHLRNDKNSHATIATTTAGSSNTIATSAAETLNFAYNNNNNYSETHFNLRQSQQQQQKQQQQQQQNKQNLRNNCNNSNGNKRKRSWSRAVFSNLQRKGLEIQFQQQKYITKPDRRKLAARLNLTDAQVKVWFQNRRMKWRHTRENLKSGHEKFVSSNNLQTSSTTTSTKLLKNLKTTTSETNTHSYTSEEECSSADGSEREDNYEIDVVE